MEYYNKVGRNNKAGRKVPNEQWKSVVAESTEIHSDLVRCTILPIGETVIDIQQEEKKDIVKIYFTNIPGISSLFTRKRTVNKNLYSQSFSKKGNFDFICEPTVPQWFEKTFPKNLIWNSLYYGLLGLVKNFFNHQGGHSRETLFGFLEVIGIFSNILCFVEQGYTQNIQDSHLKLNDVCYNRVKHLFSSKKI